MPLDKFGITKLFPDADTGIKWYSNWDNGVKRTVKSKGVTTGNPDPNDPMVDLHSLSYSAEGNQMIVYGNGQAKLRGKHPRIYVNNRGQDKFKNVEMTCYAKFEKAIVQSESYTTFRLATRSNHQDSHKCPCNGKGYASEIFIRQDNLAFKDARFRKELIHPHYANAPWAKQTWEMSKWLGMKFVCFTDKNNNVVNQTYLDFTDGINGGKWIKVGEKVDSGDWAITEDKELLNIESDISKCKDNCLDSKPVKPYNEKILRPGISSYLRTDFIHDCYFKKFSVREIRI